MAGVTPQVRYGFRRTDHSTERGLIEALPPWPPRRRATEGAGDLLDDRARDHEDSAGDQVGRRVGDRTVGVHLGRALVRDRENFAVALTVVGS
jgi:hypothetical protein